MEKFWIRRLIWTIIAQLVVFANAACGLQDHRYFSVNTTKVKQVFGRANCSTDYIFRLSSNCANWFSMCHLVDSTSLHSLNFVLFRCIKSADQRESLNVRMSSSNWKPPLTSCDAALLEGDVKTSRQCKQHFSPLLDWHVTSKIKTYLPINIFKTCSRVKHVPQYIRIK